MNQSRWERFVSLADYLRNGRPITELPELVALAKPAWAAQGTAYWQAIDDTLTRLDREPAPSIVIKPVEDAEPLPKRGGASDG